MASSHLSRALVTVATAAVVFLGAGCPGDGGFVSGDGGPAVDKSPFVNDKGKPVDAPTVYACDTVDILFVVDNSGSMFQEQTNLTASFSKLIAEIEAIQPKIKSFHVGVISTDVGAGPHTYTGSSCKPGGDAGKLLNTPATGCSGSYPLFLEGPSASLAADFACVAALGTAGCGFEQQFEAAHQALTNQPANAGFLRKNAPLAIIFISDEDDCSAADDKLFDPAAVATLGSLKTRCVAHKELLRPVSYYIDAFKKLKDDDKRVVVAAITGPPGKVVIDENKFAGQEPICSSTQFGEAAAGNRFSELVTAFGERGVQKSLCDGDMAQALEVIGKAIQRVCLN